MGFMIERLEGCTVWRVYTVFGATTAVRVSLRPASRQCPEGLRFIVVSRSWEAAALMGKG